MREIKFELVIIRNSKVIRKHIFKLTEAKPSYALIDGMTEVFRVFTGLLDKNGREIYEGDITRLTVQKVAGKYGEGIGEFKVMEVKLWAYYGYTGVGRSDRIERGIDSVEVIGNIYENPELLEVRNG